MKSSYTKATKTTTTYSKGDNKPKYQQKSTTQTVKTIDTSKYFNKRANPPATLAKPTSKPVAKPVAKPVTKPVAKPVSKPVAKPVAKPAAKSPSKPAAKPLSSYSRTNPKTQNQPKPPTQTPKINIDMSKYMSKRANTASTLPKKDDKPKWQANKNDVKKYDRKNVGNTQTKVETMQDGEYLIKVTTTRKVVDKGSYDNRYGTDRRGGYGRK